MEESDAVPSLSITVGGQEASREGRWRRKCSARAWTKKGTGQKGGTSGGRRLLWWLGGAAERNGAGGSGGRHCVEGGNGGEREGPGHDGGQLGRPATTPSRRARAVQLPRDRGGRRGAGDSARGRLTSGARRQRGPVVSGGVREGEEKMRQRGGGHWPTGLAAQCQPARF
jgi:hypothetical protein